MDKELIRIAEAMGSPKGGWTSWNPELNVNDDYLILVWARTQNVEFFGRFKDALVEMREHTSAWHGSCYTWNYLVGDYYRAILKAIPQSAKPVEELHHV